MSLTAGKGFWSEILGVGDFYYELGVQIIEVMPGPETQKWR